jgi:hypothetical protein
MPYSCVECKGDITDDNGDFIENDELTICSECDAPTCEKCAVVFKNVFCMPCYESIMPYDHFNE